MWQFSKTRRHAVIRTGGGRGERTGGRWQRFTNQKVETQGQFVENQCGRADKGLRLSILRRSQNAKQGGKIATKLLAQPAKIVAERNLLTNI
jgi:hypothetical protein